jgi:hypothetical protein
VAAAAVAVALAESAIAGKPLTLIEGERVP